MSSMETKRWIDSQLAGLGQSPRNALTATFQIAVLRALSLRMTKRVHEEPLTGFLLGAFASLAPVCSAAFENEEQALCDWQYFPKSGSGDLTEASSGADFALIIENQDQKHRLAVFQAKRENESPPDTFDIHQVREPRADAEGVKRPTSIPQFLRLLEHAKKVAKTSHARIPLKHIHWAHYLIYSASTLRCVSIDQLGFVEKFYQNVESPGLYSSPGVVHLNGLSARSFLWLLTHGANPSCEGNALNGWLEIPHEYVQAVRNSLISFTDVYVARHGPIPTLDNDPGADPSSSPETITKLACKALLSLDDVPEGYVRIPSGPQEESGPSKRRKSGLGGQ